MPRAKQAPKKCWYCGQDSMRPTGSHYTCQKCGATDTDLPMSSGHPFVGEGKEATRRMMKGK